jgi:hypothetical protein
MVPYGATLVTSVIERQIYKLSGRGGSATNGRLLRLKEHLVVEFPLGQSSFRLTRFVARNAFVELQSLRKRHTPVTQQILSL